MISSVARPGPTSLVRRCVPPAPGRRPSRTSGRPSSAPSARPSEAEVAGERELEPAAERVAVDRGDRRLGQLGEAREDLLREQRAVDSLRGDPLELVDVGAGHEDALERAADEHCARLGVGGELRGRRVQLGHDLLVDRVQGRPVEREHGDPLVGEALEADDAAQPRRR